ncbi:MAG TPA: hypothetical protein VKM55_16465 [Candidatus Lokiarchaeia archaeon]|nr:hypothetical protein [Candidatus Lokiarchaeia archaeon]
MVSEEGYFIPSSIVMEDYIKPAMEYYRVIIDKIAPYFFCESLIKMVAFQQLVVTKNYRIARHDARKSKNADFVKSCVSQIIKPEDLIRLMDTWRAFDLCLTAPSFVNPVLATNIRKEYCQVGSKFFDCHECTKIACKNNLIWEKSTLMFDLDSDEGELEQDFYKMHDVLESLGLEYAIKLSSLGGLHLNVGLPREGGTTIFDRNVYQYCLFKELRERGVAIDDNSLDPIPILRSPFSLHYKRLTPSISVDSATITDAITLLESIEALPMQERIPRSLEIAFKWSLQWHVLNSSMDAYADILKKWKDIAIQAIFRVRNRPVTKKTNVGAYLKKGQLMTAEDEKNAIKLLLMEGKSIELASKIVDMQKKKVPELRESKKIENEIILETYSDVPKKILEVQPPAVLLIIDNSTMAEMQELTGVRPIPIKTTCTKTDEAMKILFKDSNLLRRYAHQWNCKTVYIGGLYTAYNYCGAADLVVAVKMESVWDRDMKILNEMEKILRDYDDILVVTHLLGLDFCKDNQIETSGAMLTFKRIIKAVLATNSNIVITSDHSGEEFVPYFEVITLNQHVLDSKEIN